ncbi:MAG: hypothetical protein A2147_03845 [Chloroflexi bacterium RBG_16_57_8]|nr:MAG: hypothetical protein A2147_03845 [Chloroflexi bacterium RBG_16_57_8]
MDYVNALSGLISIDTSAPPGDNYGETMECLAPLFRHAGFQTETVVIPPEHAEGQTGRVNLVCHRRSQGKPRLIFYGHVDVVPAAGWDAFSPRFADGKIYGRGAADMKGGIVALLGGLDTVRGASLRYDVSVVVTTDEEVSQASQLHYLAHFLAPVNGANVFSLDNSFGYVSIAGLGALHMVIKVKGKSVHSALSHLGENAIEKAVPLLQALLDLKSRVVKRESRVGAHPDTGLSRMQARLNINVINGGLKVNIVPDQCLISIDRRLIPEEDIAGAEREILDCLSSVPGVDWGVESSFKIPTVPPCEDAIVDELSAVIQKVTGTTGKFGEMGSGDLSHIVTSEWKGKEFGLGVIRPECNIHGNTEFVYLRDIEALAEIIAEFLV